MKKMKYKIIKKNDLSKLISLFANNCSDVQLTDEIEYFDEFSPADWLYFEKDKKLVGYIRHFPDFLNDFSPIEYYFIPSVKESEIIESIHLFNDIVSSKYNLRLYFNLSQKEYIETFTTDFPVKQQFNYYSIDLNKSSSITNSTRISNNTDIPDIIRILNHFGKYNSSIIEKWIRNKCSYSFEINNKIIGVCYIHCIHDKIEIEMIALAPEYRGKGYASQFIKELFTIFHSQKFNYLFLKVNEKNLSAVKLYEKNNMFLDFDKTEVWMSKR